MSWLSQLNILHYYCFLN